MPLFGPPDVEKMKAKRDVDGLIKALQYKRMRNTGIVEFDNTAPVRKQAADALGELGDARAIEPLIVALDDNGGVRDSSRRGIVGWHAANALSKFGTPAVEPLIAALKKKNKVVQVAAADGRNMT